MNHPDKKKILELRSQAQALDVTLQVGKNGINDATTDELKAQLQRRKLVKVRLLAPATAEAGTKSQAEALAAAVGGILIEVRGHTAVIWKT